MVFKPLSFWMEKYNSKYYKDPDTNIYDDFLTYAQSPHGILADANATKFYDHNLHSDKESLSILEVGVGNGNFAHSFLSRLKELDEKKGTTLLERVDYTIADFSRPILAKAKDSIKKFDDLCKLDSFLFDASTLTNCDCGEMSDKNKGLGRYDHIRCNELFSDLPADMYVKLDEQIMQVLFDEDMDKELVEIGEAELDELQMKLISKLPENHFIPLNKIALNSLIYLCNHLAPETYLETFDYGFYKQADFDIPADMWNDSTVREYGGQWTVDLNFIYLSAELSDQELTTVVKEQKEYVQEITGERPVHKDEGSLDYDFETSGFDEDDFYYSLQIQN